MQLPVILIFNLILGFNQNKNLKDKKILDLFCGRGGGCDYIEKTLKPRLMIGVDDSEQTIIFCRKQYENSYFCDLENSKIYNN